MLRYARLTGARGLLSLPAFRIHFRFLVLYRTTFYCENELISMLPAWDKEKISVPDRIRTYDLLNTGRALYPLELRRNHGERGHILRSFLRWTQISSLSHALDMLIIHFHIYFTELKISYRSFFHNFNCILCFYNPKTVNRTRP